MKNFFRCCRIFLQTAVLILPVMGYSQMFWGVEEIPIKPPSNEETSISVFAKPIQTPKSSKLSSSNKIKNPKTRFVKKSKGKETPANSSVKSQKNTKKTEPVMTPKLTQLKGTPIFPEEESRQDR